MACRRTSTLRPRGAPDGAARRWLPRRRARHNARVPGTYDPRSVGPSPLAGPRGAAALHRAIARWYADHARALPWRDPEGSPWAVRVSEVMLQQTPVSRVEPVWRRWLDSWPTPAQLATASPADAIRAWGRLGYPRRALRLLECARLIVERHHGDVPRTRGELTALPGVGDYTASAVLAFGYGERSVVLDTNVRRVLARVLAGQALPAPHLGATERARATEVLPRQPARAAAWGVGVMELGALVCTATSPDCAGCPLTRHCAWYQAGLPPMTARDVASSPGRGPIVRCEGSSWQQCASRQKRSRTRSSPRSSTAARSGSIGVSPLWSRTAWSRASPARAGQARPLAAAA